MIISSHDLTVIDDKLPYNPDDGSLMCMFVLPSKDGNDFRSPHQKFWPSLLEKAVRQVSLTPSIAL